MNLPGLQGPGEALQSAEDGEAENGQEVVKPPEPMIRIGPLSVKGWCFSFE